MLVSFRGVIFDSKHLKADISQEQDSTKCDRIASKVCCPARIDQMGLPKVPLADFKLSVSNPTTQLDQRAGGSRVRNRQMAQVPASAVQILQYLHQKHRY